ncbi:hypothetical protein HLB44_29930 [Aquincola sp. S2]|uniref:Uncharacterized protein n=1 Tax=Pseudaquabacterium terrae TaxID=2732868 RepID=A0ABX2ER71_9BURK|nr:hypothetical protein [Aquabacterium terrae]NRF71220.1 hypothetical protein [Aquabacterium terrae]
MALSGDESAFRVYLSSTVDDLSDERVLAARIIGCHARVVDSYAAGVHSTVVNCLRDARHCHLHVVRTLR